MKVGDNFNPEIGLVRRDDMRRHFALGRFSPRPRAHRHVRKLSWVGSGARIENGAGRLETRTAEGEFAIEFHNGDRFSNRAEATRSSPAILRNDESLR